MSMYDDLTEKPPGGPDLTFGLRRNVWQAKVAARALGRAHGDLSWLLDACEKPGFSAVGPEDEAWAEWEALKAQRGEDVPTATGTYQAHHYRMATGAMSPPVGSHEISFGVRRFSDGSVFDGNIDMDFVSERVWDEHRAKAARLKNEADSWAAGAIKAADEAGTWPELRYVKKADVQLHDPLEVSEVTRESVEKALAERVDEVCGPPIASLPESAIAIAKECDRIKAFLVGKNLAYGNSALEPVRIFSTASTVEQLLVRIDDKLSRMQRGFEHGSDDTTLDLLGYLILLRIALKEADK